MYNEKLNQEWIDRLKERVSGKSITVVGNAASLFSPKKFGKFIDESDFVLRFGRGYPDPAFRDYLGTKTDAWFFGAMRAGMIEKFKDAEFKIFTPAQLNAYKKNVDLVLIRDMMNGKIQVYRDFFMTGTVDDLLKCREAINGDAPDFQDARVSQGADCLNFLATKVDTYKELNLVGFDFFKGEFAFTIPGNANFPSVQPGTSWHCPLINNHYKENPHKFSAEDGMTNEERFIRNIPRAIVHEMPPVNEAKMAALLDRLRGKQAKLIRKENP